MWWTAIIEHPHNIWFTLGGLLLILELLGTNWFLLWIGFSALLVGILVYMTSMSWEYQGVIFALVAIISVVIWWYWLCTKDYNYSLSTLNRNGLRFIGLRTYLSEPLNKNGFGRLHLGNSTWIVHASEDLPAGILVEVYAIKGIILQIRRILQK